jgi:hypothetical protein
VAAHGAETELRATEALAREGHAEVRAVSEVADEGVGADLPLCGANLSFSADTLVATPSGARAIGSLKVGDTVEAYNPTTGKAEPQTVQHVWINHDHDLVDVTLRTDPAPVAGCHVGQSAARRGPGARQPDAAL